MKIIYCTTYLYNRSGKERIIVDKANWLAAHGHDVTIVTTEQQERPDAYELRNVKRADLGLDFFAGEQAGILKKYIVRRKRNKAFRSRLEKLLLEWRPDIVISTFDDEIEFLHSINDGSKKIVEIHFHRWFRLDATARGWLWRLIYRYMSAADYRNLRKYDRFICLTEEDSKNWKGLKNMSVIPNFVSVTPEEQSDLSHKSMIAVGRLAYQKGYDYMIDAWKLVTERHPDWQLRIFGDGNEKQELEQQVKSLGLQDSICFHQPTAHIEQEYLNSSALLFTSRYEGFGLVLAEAMMCGVPPVSFSCPCGPRDIIDNGRTGLLVPPNDVEAFADAVCRIIESPELLRELGRNARKEAQKYTSEAIMPRWEALFREVLGK